MFFFSATARGLADKFESRHISESQAGSMTLTVVTDGFLSHYRKTPDGFSLFESPFGSQQAPESAVYSRISCDSRYGKIEVWSSPDAGRTVYYYLSPAGEFFCSTHIRMLRQAGVPIEPNADVLPEFLVYLYVVPPLSLYRNIMQLPAGATLCLSVDGQKVRLDQCRPHVPPQPESPSPLHSDDRVCNRTLELLTDACKELIPFSDKVHLPLSGGLDSSILVRVCQGLWDVRATHSAGHPLEAPGRDLEKQYAISAAHAFGVDHDHYVPSTKDYLLGLVDTVAAAEVPCLYLQSVLLYLLCRDRFQQEPGIVVSGDGADSLFGTELQCALHAVAKARQPLWFYALSRYPWIRWFDRISRMTGRGRRVAKRLYVNPDLPVRLHDPNHPIWAARSHGHAEWVCAHFGLSHRELIKNRCRLIAEFDRDPLVRRLTVLSLFTSVSLTQGVWNKLAEAVRKTLYYPFCRSRLTEYALSVPYDVRFSSPKAILRRVARQLSVPSEIVNRRKLGWNVLQADWARRDGALEPLVALAKPCFDEQMIRSLQAAEWQKAMTLWALLAYAIWKRLCVDGESPDALKDELRQSIDEHRQGRMDGPRHEPA